MVERRRLKIKRKRLTRDTYTLENQQRVYATSLHQMLKKSKSNPNGLSMDDVHRYLTEALGVFVNDPPDTAFHVGYKAGLESAWEDLFLTQEDRRLLRAPVLGDGMN